MERGQVFANQLLQVQLEAKTAALVDILDQQLQAAQVSLQLFADLAYLAERLDDRQDHDFALGIALGLHAQFVLPVAQQRANAQRLLLGLVVNALLEDRAQMSVGMQQQ